MCYSESAKWEACSENGKLKQKTEVEFGCAHSKAELAMRFMKSL